MTSMVVAIYNPSTQEAEVGASRVLRAHEKTLTQKHKGWGCGSVAERFSSKRKKCGLIPSTEKN
jgi:hypothetical protein